MTIFSPGGIGGKYDRFSVQRPLSSVVLKKHKRCDFATKNKLKTPFLETKTFLCAKICENPVKIGLNG